MNQPHDFDDSLERSHADAHLPIWEELYRQFFPDFVARHVLKGNGWWQAAGIDVLIALNNSRTLRVDEKLRHAGYPDIALEYISNDRTGAPGWVEKQLAADYVLYVIGPMGKGFLLPTLQLQAAWRKYGGVWRKMYGDKQSDNGEYLTWFCPVPESALYKAMGEQLRVAFDPSKFRRAG